MNNKACLLCVIALGAVLLTSVAGVAHALSGYAYYIPVDIQNTSGSAIEARIRIPINAAGLVDGHFMKGNATDVRLEGGGGLEAFVAGDLGDTSAYWYTDRITLPAQSSQRKTFWLGNANATREQAWVADPDDIIAIPDDGSLDITGNITLSCTATFYTIPAGNQTDYIAHKLFAYSLGVGNDTTLVGRVYPVGGGSEARSTKAYSSTSDGYCYITGIPYADVRNDPTGAKNDSANTLIIGQDWTDPNYSIWRSYLYFDTSALPDGATITSATLSLYGNEDNSVTNFDITVQDGQPTYPHTPLEMADYDRTKYAGDGGSLNTAGFSVGAYNAINLNATGRGWIQIGGATKLCLRSSRDIAGNVPTGDEWVRVISANAAGTGQDPKLSITYTVPIGVRVYGTITTDTEYDLALTREGNTVKLYIDGNVTDTAAIGAATQSTAYDVELLQCDALVDDLGIGNTTGASPNWVAGFAFEPTEITSTAIEDQSGSGNDATITSMDGNPAGVSVTVHDLNVVDLALADVDIDDSATGLLTGLPSQPDDFFGGADWGNLPGSEIVGDFIGESGVMPEDFFWLALITLAWVALGYIAYAFTHESFVVAVLGLVFGAFCAVTMPAFGWWMIAIYLIVSLTMVVLQRQYGL